ncbi:alpha/beta fold hydrolase [Gordonia sp. NPDC003425]
MNRKAWLIGAGVAAGVAAVAVGMGTNAAGMVRDALRGEPAVDDGPDALLADPVAPCARPAVSTSDGTRLNVEVYGPDPTAADTGDVIVAVHGWACNTHYWNPQINHLADSHTFVAYDQRGHGASELGRRRPSVAMLGQDLDAVLAAVVPPGRRAVLIGHSMGGMTVLSWAAQYPEKVSTMVSQVVLASTAAKAVVQNHLLIPVDLPRYSRPFAPAVSRVFTSAPVPLPHNHYSPLLAHYIALGTHARASHVAFVDDMISACPARARGRWGAAMGRLDVTAGLDALTVPVTLVVGTEDRLTPRTHADQMADVLARSGHLRELVVLDGVGHMSTIEADQRVNALLDDLLTATPEPVGSTPTVRS